MKIEVNFKTLSILASIIAVVSGNVFLAGEIWNSQKIYMEKMMKLEEKVEDISNLYDVKASILSLENKIIQLEFFLGMSNPNSCDNPANAGKMDCK
jgi:hypothetical protein